MSVIMGIVNKILGDRGSGDVDGYIDLEKESYLVLFVQ